MIRLIVLGIAVACSTLLGAYGATRLKETQPADSGKTVSAAVEMAKLDTISVPIIRKGRIDGYVLAQVTFAAASIDLKHERALLAALVAEAAFKVFYENETMDFSSLKPMQVDATAAQIAATANARLGREAVRRVLVSSINYVSYDEARCRKA